MNVILRETNENIQRLPLGKSFKAKGFDWYNKYRQLSMNKKNHILLESGRGGKYSIIGLDPWAILSGKNDELKITIDNQTETKKGPLLTAMKEWMNRYRTTVIGNLPEFQGGAVGFISYDLIRQIESLPQLSEDDLETEDLFFYIFDDVFIFDHQKDLFWIITHYSEGQKTKAEKRLNELATMWFEPLIEPTYDFSGDTTIEEDYWNTSLSEEAFKNAVERVQNYIAAGDVFQVNLSVRQEKKLKTHPMEIYDKLREINPSPYMAYLQAPHFQLVSGSPELLVKKQGDDISTRPIAGTRSRGKNPYEDEELAKTLIENEKEKAEHVMLVDLERNDLGRVSRFGTVEVNELMVIEKYSHVMHIVSNVRGKLDSSYDVYDVVEATFPGGTITGAPKVRTMEIIEELEPVRRGVYTGSIGWIGYNGNMELNIAIRTMVSKNGYAYVQAGAGIVIDSNPRAEYKESLKKAMALWKAKELSEEEKSQVKS